ncbi:hypothetical protein [Streptomyces sp. NPDC056491]|uniref:hypothetical protein n=1 Tax=Streptomyces sp. NPDC056491 TaxID=3345837 RepID=UPI0036C561BA
MSKKTLPRGAEVAACGDRPQTTPWQRRGRRGISITIIVIELLRLRTGTLVWGDPLESALALAIVLLGFEMLCGTARRTARLFERLLPERAEFTRRNGGPRFSFGW